MRGAAGASSHFLGNKWCIYLATKPGRGARAGSFLGHCHNWTHVAVCPYLLFRLICFPGFEFFIGAQQGAGSQTYL